MVEGPRFKWTGGKNIGAETRSNKNITINSIRFVPPKLKR